MRQRQARPSPAQAQPGARRVDHVEAPGRHAAALAFGLPPKSNGVRGAYFGLPGAGPLEPRTRAAAEQSLGQPLGDVRVTTGPEASEAAARLGARAYTFGRDIVLGSGVEHGPNPILAHEVAHAAQQRHTGAGRSPVTDREAELEAGAAASAMLAGQPATVSPVAGGRVQRYESFEHARIGDLARGGEKVTIKGVTLSAGELGAMGDYYATVDDLFAADAKELARLVALIRQQVKDPSSVTEAMWDEATHGRYTKLNLVNEAHFSPQDPEVIPEQAGTNPEKNAQAVFLQYHRRALALARSAKNSTDRKTTLNRIWAIEGFAEHFLVDAFSAAHLFNKQDLVARSKASFAKLGEGEVETMLRAVANNVWSAQHELIARHQGKKDFVQDVASGWFEINSAERFTSVLQGLWKSPDGKAAVYNGIAKAVHDALRSHEVAKAGEPGKQSQPDVGITVVNELDTWVLSGDTTLAQSPKSQKWMAKALEQARANIRSVLAGKDDGDEAMAVRVFRYVPSLTDEGKASARTIIAEKTDGSQAVATALSLVLAQTTNCEGLLSALRDRGFLRLIAPRR